MRLLNLPMFAAAVVGACFAEAVLASVPTLPNFDANFTIRAEQPTAVQAKRQATSTSLELPARVQRLQALSHGVRVAQRDAQLGKPTFLWGTGSEQTPQLRAYKRSANTSALARAYLYQQAPVLQVDAGTIDQATLTTMSRLASGAHIVRFSQTFAGYEVFGRSLNVLLNADEQLIATSGYFANTKIAQTQEVAPTFQLSVADATARAFADMGGKLPAGVFGKVAEHGEYQYLSPVASGVSANYALTRPARVKPLLFPLHDTLVPAYYVEITAGRANTHDSEMYAYVISASNGNLLYRKNLVAEAAYTYRAYADNDAEGRPWDGPFGNGLSPFPGATPDADVPHVYLAANDVTVGNFNTAQPADDWLPAGASTLYGNNGYAYVDNTGNDGFDAQDYTTAPSSANTFSFNLAEDKQPTDETTKNRDVALVNAFYVVNWLHDLYYQHGFTETTGVAQADNYGRGGAASDRVLIEIQDSSGRNNADMSTPPDGSSPRMQMYLFDGAGGTYVDITSGANQGKLEDAGVADFGPQEFDVTASVVRFIDSSSTTDGCVPANNDLTGKIAIILRGECNFTVKVKNAQAAGALAAIIVNNVADSDPENGGTRGMTGDDASIIIGSLFLKQSLGQPLIDELTGGGTVTAQLFRKTPIDLDGALDSGIVAHEYFHYVSNRLIGDGLGLVNNQGNSMGEGWSDFAMLMMVVRPTDSVITGNDQFQGAYSTGGYVDANAYFGIRRYPYSTDLAKNPLTFKHIEFGTNLPPETTAPITHPFYLDGTLNNEVHAAGEVWANVLWEGYAALLNDPAETFAQDYSDMLDYLIGGLMLTPYAPTYTEARDAVLAVALANTSEPGDFTLLANAFAERGLGAGAISPYRFDDFHDDVVESFEATNLGAFAVADVNLTPQDGDGDAVWDMGETAELSVSIFNSGWDDLTGVSATASTPAAVAVPGPVNFAALANPVDCTGACEAITAQSATAIVSLTLNAATTAEDVTLTLTFADQAGVTEPAAVTLTLPVHFDAERDLVAPRNSDDMENGILSRHDWTSVVAKLPVDPEIGPWIGEAFDWQLTAAEDTNPLEDAWGTGTVWHVPDNGVPSDVTLTTPPIVVGDTAFSVSFTHNFAFEFNDPDFTANSGDEVYWDGGVVEISTDGGATWKDVTVAGGSFATGYTGVLQATNPYLPSRNAFAGNGGGIETLSFGKALTGRIVRLRFRAGSDQAIGAPGWAIDGIVITGAVDPVFASVLDEKPGSPPIADAGEAQVVKPAIQVKLAGSGSDVDGAVSYSWEQTVGPSVTLSNPAVAQPTFTAPASNEHLVFRLKVTDTDNRVAFDSATVGINANPPVADAGSNQTVDTGSSVTLNGSGSSDADGDVIIYQWIQTTGTTVALSDAAGVQPTFTAPAAATTLGFELTVTDEFGASDTDSITVTVEKPEPTNTGGSGGGGGGGSAGLLLLSTLLGLGLLRRRGGAV